MPATLEQTATTWTLRLEGEIDINGASELKKLLIQALGSGKDIELDLQKTTALDVTSLQLLWAANREALGSGGYLAFSGNLPEQLSAVSKETGFEEFPICGPRISAPAARETAAENSNDR